MDEMDIAAIENERHFERCLQTLKNKSDAEAVYLASIEKHDKANKCRYCNELLHGYESRFCDPENDWSCRSEWEREVNAIESGRVKKIYDI